jgi:hypothetical protein
MAVRNARLTAKAAGREVTSSRWRWALIRCGRSQRAGELDGSPPEAGEVLPVMLLGSNTRSWR